MLDLASLGYSEIAGGGFYSQTVSFQIITKEVETNDWKKKYEQCKQEVDEMRLENILLLSWGSNVPDEGGPVYRKNEISHFYCITILCKLLDKL